MPRMGDPVERAQAQAVGLGELAIRAREGLVEIFDHPDLGRARAGAIGRKYALEQRGGRFAAASWWVAPTEDLRGDMAFLHLLPGHDIAMLDPRVA